MSEQKNNSKQYHNKPKNNQNKPQNEFCSYNSNYTYSSFYFGFNILDLYEPKELIKIIKDPMANNELLRKLSLRLYSSNGAFTNTVDYMTALPCLYKVLIAKGKSIKNKQKNKQLMSSTLKTIRDSEITRDALFKAMVEGVAFYYFETSNNNLLSNQKTFSDYEVDSIIEINDLGMNASIISLPVDYTKIIGIQNSSYVIAFNLDYFNDANETSKQKLRKYPKEIRDAYYERRDGKKGNWVKLDYTKTMVLKIRSKRDEKYGRPLVLGAIEDILYNDYFVQTKRSVLDEINNRIIYQTFPEGKEKGTSALTKAQQENQHNAVKSAVMNKNNRGGISFFSVASGTKINSIESQNTSIFDEKNESNLNDKIALDLGIASSLLNGVGSGSYSAQQTNLELVTAQIFQWISQFETELNKCINANIIKDNNNPVELYYLPITHVNKSGMVGYAKDLYLQGCGSIGLWAAATGIDPEAFYALLDSEIEEGIYEKYKPHMTSFTLSGKDEEQKSGRPETDNPKDSTVQSRSNNGNSLPSPSDNG